MKKISIGTSTFIMLQELAKTKNQATTEAYLENLIMKLYSQRNQNLFKNLFKLLNSINSITTFAKIDLNTIGRFRCIEIQ